MAVSKDFQVEVSEIIRDLFLLPSRTPQKKHVMGGEMGRIHLLLNYLCTSSSTLLRVTQRPVHMYLTLLKQLQGELQ